MGLSQNLIEQSMNIINRIINELLIQQIKTTIISNGSNCKKFRDFSPKFISSSIHNKQPIISITICSVVLIEIDFLIQIKLWKYR